MDGVKIAPRRGMLLGMGAVGGLAAAIVLAALLGLLDRRVRLREELTLLGVPDEGAVVSGSGGSGMPWMLPAALAEIRDDIARFWSKLPYERRKTDGLRIGFVPCGEGVSAGRAAAALAIGLAAHGGEKVCYVGTLEGPSWLGQRLGLDHQCGWSEVMRGEFQLADAVVATSVQGLSYLPAGRIGPAVPHPMAGPQFAALLDRLAATHRFVIVELPDVSLRPEGRSVLGVLDGAHVVVLRLVGAKSAVREAIEAVRTAGARLLGGVLQ
jgi:Mrp family chromosome partitioning ATPase